MWWIYFALSVPEVLHERRERSFAFGYLQIPLPASVAATGAGLQVASAWIAHATVLSEVGTVPALAIPVACYVALSFLIAYRILHGATDGQARFHALLLAGTLAVIAAAMALAAASVPVGWCLLVMTFAPVVTVVGFETVGHRHLRQAAGRLLAR